MTHEAFLDLITEMENNVLGATDDVMVRTLRTTVIDFCNRSKAWEFKQPVSLLEGEVDYALTPPANTEFIEVTHVYHDGRPLSAVANDKPYENCPVGTPMVFYREGLDIRIFPAPNRDAASKPVEVKGFLKPTKTSDGVDNDMMMTLFRDALVSGAVARLMRQPGKPWTDIASSAPFQALYEQGIREAVRYQRRYQSRVPLVTSYGGL